MKILLNRKVFAVFVLMLIILFLGIGFGGDVIVKQGNQYITGKLGIGTSSPVVSLEIRNGEQRIIGSNSNSGDANDVLVVIGGRGQSGGSEAGGNGSDIVFIAGIGGKSVSSEPGTGGNIIFTAGRGGTKDYYYGTAAKGGSIRISSGTGGDVQSQFPSVKGGDSGDIEITVGDPGSSTYNTGNYGNILLAKNGGKIGIGNSSPSTTLDVSGTVKMTTLLLPVKTTAGDPANPVEGQVYVNTYENKIRVYADGAWRNLSTW